MNLIDKYGTDWFNNKFSGAYFMHNDVPSYVSKARSTGVVVVACPRVNDKVKACTITVPRNFFKDDSVFEVGDLGYRHTLKGKWLAFLSRNNSSYARGISTRNIIATKSQLTDTLSSMGEVAYITDAELCNLALQPKFIPLYDGIKLVQQGKLLSFAASPTVAVVPDPNDISCLVIIICGKPMGKVNSKGNISFVSSISKKYIEETVCHA